MFRYNFLYDLSNWQDLIEGLIKAILSFILAILIIFKYRRIEPFLTSIPTLFFIANALNVFCASLKLELLYEHLLTSGTIKFLTALTTFFITIAYWAFVLQYL